MRALMFLYAFLGAVALVASDCSADAAENRCIVSSWSAWSECSPRCSLYYDGGTIDRTRTQRRTRVVLQSPCPAAACPIGDDEGGALVQTRYCNQEPCTEAYLRCQGSCVGCRSVSYTPHSQSWCRCCANQDTARTIAEGRCQASQVGYGGGCQAVEVNSVYDLEGCVKAGFCQARNSTSRVCEEFGYCRSDVGPPAPPPPVTPANPPSPPPVAVPSPAPTTPPIPPECLAYVGLGIVSDTSSGALPANGGGGEVSGGNVTAWVLVGVLGGIASVAVIALVVVLYKKNQSNQETEMRQRVRVRAK